VSECVAALRAHDETSFPAQPLERLDGRLLGCAKPPR
jgi:hypothetical protein